MSSNSISAPNSTPPLVAISVSFERENLLARGLGLDHLRELLIRVSRPLLRAGVSLAYGGHWVDTEDNFTYDLLRLVSAEKAVESERRTAERPPGSVESATASEQTGRLINHSAWPYYQKITPAIEAQWINVCRIVRVTPSMAGLSALPEALPQAASPDDEARKRQDLWCEAVCLSSMRKLARDGIELSIPDVAQAETIPPIAARIVLGGKVEGYRGFAPGIFEEVLLNLEVRRPLFLLGGFGGASEVLAKALLGGPSGSMPHELTESGQREKTPALANLADVGHTLPLPRGVRDTSALLSELQTVIMKARMDLPAALNCGLDDAEVRQLLTTRNMREALKLVQRGLTHLGVMPAV